jgi:hypothetical protein
MNALLAHGGTVGLVLEAVLAIVGLVVLAGAVWLGAKRKIDEYDPDR